MVSFELWQQWMTQDFENHCQCTTGLPEDAKCVAVFFDHRGDPCAVFESPNLEPLKTGEYTVNTPQGETVGCFDPEFTTIYDD